MWRPVGRVEAGAAVIEVGEVARVDHLRCGRVLRELCSH